MQSCTWPGRAPDLRGLLTILVMGAALGCATGRNNNGLSSGAIFEFGPCRAAGATCGPEGRRTADGGDAALWRGGPFRAGPYLIKLGPGKFAVAFVAEGARAPRVQWWLTDESGTSSTRPKAPRQVRARRRDGIWVAQLGPFEGGERVAYRVVLSKSQRSKTYRFRAGPPAGDPFRFIAYGDTRTYHLVHWRVVNAMAQHDADFVIHTGDLVENGGVEEEWLTFFSITRPVAAQAPLLAAFGNHDVSPNGLFRRFFLFDMGSRPQALAQRYYARDWGKLRVIMMDPETEYRAGSSQYAYVRRMMAEAAQRGMYIVLVCHYPPYSSGSHGSYKAMRTVIDDLGQRYGVELVISGHDHNYERTKEMGGMTYVVTGGGGAPIHPVTPQSFSAAVRTEPHYVVVDVDDSGLALRAVNIAGETFDSHLIKPNPPKMKLAAR